MEALEKLIWTMADSQMIMGHRMSEWTGLGPVLEEDIAFASLAQDKIGHALALYTLLQEEMGAQDPDTIAFSRKPAEWMNPILAEIYSKDYAFDMVRHFMMDHLMALRVEKLRNSTNTKLAQLAHKFHAEIKYHLMHADIWMKNFGLGTQEGKFRIQSALRQAFEYAENLFIEGEDDLKELWKEKIENLLKEFGFEMPELGDKGQEHTEDLLLLLSEMTEVYNIEPSAQW